MNKTIENKGHKRHCGQCKNFRFNRMEHWCVLDEHAGTYPSGHEIEADMWIMKCSCFEKKGKS
jgi:hypothetical protein